MSSSGSVFPAGSSAKRKRHPPILWDVVEEHLQEAAFFWRQHERALFSAEESLEDVAGGDEHRLRMHLDALLVGGEAILQRVLLPALEAEDDSLAGPAAYVLLESKGQQGLQPVLDALVHAEDGKQQGLCRALELSSRSDLDAALVAALPRHETPLQAQLVRCLARRQADGGPLLESLYTREDASLRAAVLLASRYTEPGRAQRLVQRGLEESHPQVRDAAILTGLVLGMRAAWWRCQSVVKTRAPQAQLALLALGMSGGVAEVELLLTALEQPTLRTDALWGLGFSGQRAAADEVLGVLKARGEVLAAESFAAITGLVLGPDFIEEAAPTEDDELPAAAERSMWGPGPHRAPFQVRLEAVDSWWKQARSRFEPGRRYLHGQPWTPELLLRALEVVPTRRSRVLALELAVRTRGAISVEPTAWASRQRGQLHQARHLKPGAMAGSFENFLRT